ncbi:sister chromatid cohesion 1 protein 3 [Mangifera indica]|uniref:sister chromatid cohesion 1 protein 3 n=1 Tax=Mangifera indica TaxID=29780 RepID=UPI001CF9C8EC|nr:sister chromatid cohesion 1 protein 3 [Mangifera indica]
MFYSQTFLARKGPLGTVWCAAHLQHRLKKSHYTSTNIPSTVDRIMFPEVPIALRLSGHLLLGVVRIYSKKVDYLHHDCNVVLIGLRKAFTTVNVNLPEDATQAQIESITFPERMDLDAVDLDDLIYDDHYDRHLRDQEEITLTDQIPIGRDIYVAISFDEDVIMDSVWPEEVANLGVQQMETIVPVPPMDADAGFQLGPSNQTEVLSETVDDQNAGVSNQREPLSEALNLQQPEPGQSNQTDVLDKTMDFQEPSPSNQTDNLDPRKTDQASPHSVPEFEVMRDATHDFSPGNMPPVFTNHVHDATEPLGSPGKNLNEKEVHTLNLEDVLESGGLSFQFHQHSEPSASAVSQEAAEIFDTHISLGHPTPELAIRSTPPVQRKKPRALKRKILDKSIVLSNKFMKKALEDSSYLLRKKRNLPGSDLEVWKLNNHVRKEQVFQEPSLTGMCEDIRNIFKKDYISAKPYLFSIEEDIVEPMAMDSLAPETEANLQPLITDSPALQAQAILDPGVVQSPLHTTESILQPRIVESPHHSAEAIQEPSVACSSSPVPENDMEIERFRNEERNIGNDNLPEFMASGKDGFTPFSTNTTRSGSVSQAGTTVRSPTLPTPDVAALTGTRGSELETPTTLIEEGIGLEYTGLSDIPELVNTAEAEELSFLEAENNTPTGSQASQGVDSLSVRTRAVAQYLKHHSPITPVSEDPSGHLSLNKILTGKTRKLSARMFFETLVLKSHGLIDVQQEEPYGDIALKLTDTLSKADI